MTDLYAYCALVYIIWYLSFSVVLSKKITVSIEKIARL